LRDLSFPLLCGRLYNFSFPSILFSFSVSSPFRDSLPRCDFLRLYKVVTNPPPRSPYGNPRGLISFAFSLINPIAYFLVSLLPYSPRTLKVQQGSFESQLPFSLCRLSTPPPLTSDHVATTPFSHTRESCPPPCQRLHLLFKWEATLSGGCTFPTLFPFF